MGIFPACVSMYHACAVLWKPKEGFGSPGIGVTVVSPHLGAGNPSLRQEQQMFLSPEPSHLSLPQPCPTLIFSFFFFLSYDLFLAQNAPRIGEWLASHDPGILLSSPLLRWDYKEKPFYMGCEG